VGEVGKDPISGTEIINKLDQKILELVHSFEADVTISDLILYLLGKF
jgi:hypothetical protein